MDNLFEVVYCGISAHFLVFTVGTRPWVSRGMRNGTGSWLALAVNLTQSRITWDKSVIVGRSKSGWPGGMPVLTDMGSLSPLQVAPFCWQGILCCVSGNIELSTSKQASKQAFLHSFFSA